MDRQTDARPFHRSCYAYYASSVNNPVSKKPLPVSATANRPARRSKAPVALYVKVNWTIVEKLATVVDRTTTLATVGDVPWQIFYTKSRVGTKS